ncbi:MAG: NACHT domain-containing protein [Catenulispora sp.]
MVAILTVLGAVAAFVLVLKPLVPVLKAVGKRLAKLTGRLDPEAEARAVRFRQFAKHIENQLNRLAEHEEWLDDRFAELEAEIEIEGSEWLARWLRWLPARTTKRRRVSSLTRALERSSERLIVLEGEPGSGKSVTLRHLAILLARKAANSRKPQLVPLYVNLKEFHPASHPVTSDVVREFVLSSLKRVKDRSVEVFLEEEFDAGLAAGRWLIILDSFDETPAILTAVDADPVILEYSGAISDFLHGVNQCRGIIASREFRGPRALRLPRFSVMPLTAKQQDDLVRRFGLGADPRRRFREGMATADVSIRQLATNPMFLSLVCSYVRDVGSFPAASHVVFEAYVRERLDRDADRIRRRFELDVAVVRAVAERVAFAMTSTESMGLSPSRRSLHAALPHQTQLDSALDALEYIKLGRAVIDDNAGDNRGQFSFSHRRFQEYFATCVVLRESAMVNPAQLLTSGRWRETAVTLLQTQPIGELAEFFEVMRARLDLVVRANIGSGKPFDWGRGTLHILGILATGMASRLDEIPEALRKRVGVVLAQAWLHGSRLDQKWAVEVAFSAPDVVADRILRFAFASESAVLQDVAYTSASRLPEPSEQLMVGIRRGLARVAFDGRLWRESIEIMAQLRRLRDPERALPAFRALKGAQVLGVCGTLLCLVLVAWRGVVVPVDMRFFSTLRTLFFNANISDSERRDIRFDLHVIAMPGMIVVAMLFVIVAGAADIVSLLRLRMRVPAALKAFSMRSVRDAVPLGSLTVALLPCWIFIGSWFFLVIGVVSVYWRLVSVHAVEHGCGGFWRTLLVGPVNIFRHNWTRVWLSFSWRDLFMGLSLAGLMGVCIPVGVLALSKIHLSLARFEWVPTAVPICILVGLLLALLAFMYEKLLSRLHADRVIQSIKAASGVFTSGEALDMVAKNAFDRSAVLRILRVVRTRPELFDDGVVDALATLAAEWERAARPAIPVSSELEAWRRQNPRGYEKLKRHLSHGAVDQITLIVEAVRAPDAKRADGQPAPALEKQQLAG